MTGQLSAAQRAAAAAELRRLASEEEERAAGTLVEDAEYRAGVRDSAMFMRARANELDQPS